MNLAWIQANAEITLDDFIKRKCPDIKLNHVVFIDQIPKIGDLRKTEFLIFNQGGFKIYVEKRIGGQWDILQLLAL